MSAALVGSRGAVSNVAAATVTPAMANGTPTAGSSLVAFVGARGNGNAITCNDGSWTKIADVVQGTLGRLTIWYKPLCDGTETSPQWACTSAGGMVAGISEFSGLAGLQTQTYDQQGANSATTSPVTATCGAADAQPAEMVFSALYAIYSVAGTKTTSQTYNNGVTATDSQNNDGTSSLGHHRSSWGTTTGKSVADNDQVTATATNLTALLAVVASFKVALVPTGIATSEVVSASDKVLLLLSPTGIASAQAFGTTVLRRILSATGIASAQAFGVASARRILAAVGITSGKALGIPNVPRVIAPASVSSGKAFGTASLVRLMSPVGIAPGAFGTPAMLRLLGPDGIASREAFGTAQVVVTAPPVFVVTNVLVADALIASAELADTILRSFGVSDVAVSSVALADSALSSVEVADSLARSANVSDG